MAIEWYSVHTYVGYEDKVALNIESRSRALGMFGTKIFQVLIPTEDAIEQKDGKKETVKKKTYQGYIFVQMDVDDELEPDKLNEAWEVVRGTQGVTGFVGTKNPRSPSDLFPLSPEEINRILEGMGVMAQRKKRPKSKPPSKRATPCVLPQVLSAISQALSQRSTSSAAS